MEIEEDLRMKLADIRVRQRVLQEIRTASDAIGDPRLYPYQRVGVCWMHNIYRGILADEQGLGKTVMAAAACKIAHLYNKPVISVIICTSSNITNWLDHMEEYFQEASRRWVDSKRGKAFLKHPDGSKTYVVNYENISAISAEVDKIDFLIVDEAHKIRNRAVKAFKLIRALAHDARFVWLLTASPTVNADNDLWTLLHLCDPTRFSSYWSYIFRFFKVDSNGFGMKINGVKEEERDNLLKMTRHYILHRGQENVKLPRMKRREVIYVLPEAHRELYQPMEDEWVTSLNEEAISAPTKVAQVTRLRQLAIDPKLIFPDYTGPSKLGAVIDILDACDKVAVVFTNFAEAAKLLKKTLLENGISCRSLTGDVSTSKRQGVLEGLGQDYRVLAVTHGTGGEGLNLVQATLAIFLDLAWHPAGNIHAQKRIHRIGQKFDVEVISIRSSDTIEDHIADIIANKGKMAINELIAKYRRKD